MRSKLEKRLQRETDRLQKRRLEIERQIKDLLQKELLEVEAARLKGRSGNDPWSRVTWLQRVADFVAGVTDGVMARHTISDPILSYRKHLQRLVDRSKIRQRSARSFRYMSAHGIGEEAPLDDDRAKDRRVDGSRITDRDRILARIADLQSRITLIDKAAEEDVDTVGAAIKDLIDEEFEQCQAVHDRWYNYLQRPAYFESVSSDVRANAEAAALQASMGRDGQSQPTTLEKTANWIERSR